MFIYANGCKYNVKQYLSLHPGGATAILSNIDKDCTYHYNMHSSNAKKIWKSMQSDDDSFSNRIYSFLKKFWK